MFPLLPPFLSFYIWAGISWYKISLRLIWVSCANCVPSQELFYLQPTDEGWEVGGTVLVLCQHCSAVPKTLGVASAPFQLPVQSPALGELLWENEPSSARPSTRCDLTRRDWHCPLPGRLQDGTGAWAPWPNLLCLLSFPLGITNGTSSVPGAGLEGHGSHLPENDQEGNCDLTIFPFFSSIPSLLISLGFYFCLTFPLANAAFPKHLRVGSAWANPTRSYHPAWCFHSCLSFSGVKLFFCMF